MNRASLPVVLLLSTALPGCMGTRYGGGVRYTPEDEHPVQPEFTFGVHPAGWVPSQATRRWDVGAGIHAGPKTFGFYAEGSGVPSTPVTGMTMPLGDGGPTPKVIDRTSVGAQMRWNLEDGPRPETRALVMNDAGGFIRKMHPQGGVWGEAMVGLYVGTTFCGCKKWSISTGINLRTPVVGIDKM